MPNDTTTCICRPDNNHADMLRVNDACPVHGAPSTPPDAGACTLKDTCQCEKCAREMRFEPREPDAGTEKALETPKCGRTARGEQA